MFFCIILGLILLLLSITRIRKNITIQCIGMSLCLIVFLVTLYLPIAGFERSKCIAEYELVPVATDCKLSKKEIYVVQNGKDYTYMYTQKVDNEKTDIMTQVIGKLGKKIFIVESEGSEEAILRVYEQKGKRSFWSLAMISKIEYVFFVPSGTVLEQ